MHIPADPPPFIGRCLCDQVTYRLVGLPLSFYACHCTDCQKRTGSAFRLVMVVNRADLEVTRGTAELRAFTFGHKPRRARMCPHCDTRLWAEPEQHPHVALLLPGTLDRAAEFTPVAHLWMKSAVPWFQPPVGAVCFQTQPEKRGVLERLWQLGGAVEPSSGTDPHTACVRRPACSPTCQRPTV